MSNPNLLLLIYRDRNLEIERRASQLGPALAELRAHRRPPTEAAVTMRLAGAADGPLLTRLAELDSGCVPAAPVLIGERDGRPVAALSMEQGAVVADPFVPTADVIALLALRARQLRGGPPRRTVRHRLAAWRPLRTSRA